MGRWRIGAFAALFAAACSARDLSYLTDGASDAGANDANDAGGSPSDASSATTTPEAATPSMPCDGGVLGDGQNCGVCGHDCLGGGCSAGVCQPVTIASGFDHPLGLLLNGDTLLVGHATGIDAISFDGKTRETFLPTHGQVSQLATDGTSLFFGNRDDATLHQVGLRDLTDMTLGTSIEVIYGVAASTSAVFYSRTPDMGPAPNSLVEHMPIGGGAVSLITVDSPLGIDWADDTLYLAFSGSVTTVVNDVRSASALFAGGTVVGVKVDGDGLLLTVRDAKTLVRVPRVAGAAQVLAQGLDDPGQIAATPTAIYFTEIGAGLVQRLAR